MGRRLSAALALACWLVAACSYSSYPAETSPLACINGGDDDGDDLMDCADPDCWGFAYCRIRSDGGAPFVPPDLPPELPDSSLPPLGPPYYPPADGSTPSMPDADVPDPPPDAEVDAELPTVCDEYCPPGECGEGGVCNVPLVFGDYGIESIELFAPRMEGNVCFDAPTDILFGCSIDGLSLCCNPDIKVVVHIDGTKVGWVTQRDAYAKTWEAVDMIPFELREGHEVRFDVADEDKADVGDPEPEPGMTERAIFGCTTFVDTAAIRSGRIGCKPDPEAYDFPAGINYRVSASIARLGGGGPAEEDDEP